MAIRNGDENIVNVLQFERIHKSDSHFSKAMTHRAVKRDVGISDQWHDEGELNVGVVGKPRPTMNNPPRNIG